MTLVPYINYAICDWNEPIPLHMIPHISTNIAACCSQWFVNANTITFALGVHDIYGMVFVGDRIWLSGCPGNLNSTT